MLYSYTTSLKADNGEFKRVCSAIEKNILGIKKDKLLIDVDGSATQKYKTESKEIVVQNDFEVDAVYIDSDVDLKGIVKSVV